MWKTYSLGGIKLININVKSKTSKVKWMTELATNPNLKLNLDIFTTLLGTQKGNIRGRDLFFLKKSYYQNQLKTESKFYKEALFSTAQLNIKKGVKDLHAWNRNTYFITHYS